MTGEIYRDAAALLEAMRSDAAAEASSALAEAVLAQRANDALPGLRQERDALAERLPGLQEAIDAADKEYAELEAVYLATRAELADMPPEVRWGHEEHQKASRLRSVLPLQQNKVGAFALQPMRKRQALERTERRLAELDGMIAGLEQYAIGAAALATLRAIAAVLVAS